jgi:3-methyladenine DNA glycosylase AlkD
VTDVTAADIVARLEALGSPENRAGMARFGIDTSRALGISVTQLRAVAKELPRDRALAQKLWETGIHEARLLATMVDDPGAVDVRQMEAWSAEFNSWDLVDQCCSNLFVKTPWAVPKATEWTRRGEEFVKRAGFALIASLAIHDKKAPDEVFERFLPLIEAQAGDDRNFVKKAVNWALRQIGKRNRSLNLRAIAVAERLEERDERAARWIGRDALKELGGDAVQRRLAARREERAR